MEPEIVPQVTLTVKSYSRPIRIAFFVDPENTTDQELNQIIRYCTRVWGGRYHTIIPTDGTDISSDYWRLFEMLDPDVVFSLFQLKEELIFKINRRVYPQKF